MEEFTIQEAKSPEGFAKFLTVGNGVTLVRFHGKDTIHLAARRKGTSGNPNALFTIDVNKVTKSATIKKDGKTLFAIDAPGCNYSRLEGIAVSALHRWFKGCRPCCSKRRRAKKARMAAENGKYFTPPLSVGEGGEMHDPECGSGFVFCNPPMTKQEVK